jgi:hypothetical protein
MMLKLEFTTLCAFLLMALAVSARVEATPVATPRDYGDAQLMQIRQMKVAVFENPESVRLKSLTIATSDPALQARVDAAAQLIFTSSYARSQFCPFLPDADAAAHNFGVSAKAAGALVKKCHDAGIPAAPQPAVFNLKIKLPRRIIMVETEEPAPLESWTSYAGDTHLFTHGPSSDFVFVRSLLHEYYVAFDKLWRLSAQTASFLFNGDFDDAVGRSRADINRLLNLMAIPLVRGTLLMARTYEFENRVLGEITPEGSRTTSLQKSKEPRPCWQIARSLAEFLFPRQDLFVDLEYFVVPARLRVAASGLEAPPAIFDIIEKWETESGFKLRQKGREISLCDTMLEPRLGVESSFFTQGPRVRIGGGVDTSHTLSDRWPLSFTNAVLELKEAKP